MRSPNPCTGTVLPSPGRVLGAQPGWAVFLGVAAVAIAPFHSVAAPVVRSTRGLDPTGIQITMGQFRADLGGVNNGVSTNTAVFSTGRREINWDAAALPGNMPADFFNKNSRRGAVFSTPGGGFLVSANVESGPTRFFGDLNPALASQFSANSPNRLFAPLGSTITEVRFFVPGHPEIPATVSGFGAVFTDIEVDGSSSIEYYDVLGDLMAREKPLVGSNGSLAFVGVSFNQGERIFRVVIQSGTTPLNSSSVDGGGGDVVALDDFIYGEPQPAPQAFTGTGSDSLGLAGVLTSFRNAIGGTNNGVASTSTQLTSGRREINWDAAALPADMPFDFFNRVSRRGAMFGPDGTGFAVSENSDAFGAGLFATMNPDHAAQFMTNSPNRLFTPSGTTTTDIRFAVPGDPGTPATIHAFGAVFTDVETAGGSWIAFYDLQDHPLAKIEVPVSGQRRLSFAGMVFQNGERIARIRIQSGTAPILGTPENLATGDLVALDDFIYSEPRPAPVLTIATGANAAQIAPAITTFRNSIGGANNGVATAGGPILASGRREINWDAAALPVAMPADFFNVTSRRGAIFSTPGTGFQVSANVSTGSERLFGNVHPVYPNHFNTNSANRLFAAVDSTAFDMVFTVPSHETIPATVGAFGAVFTDVDAVGTRLEFFNSDGALLTWIDVPATGDKGLVFAGVQVPPGERIARVRVNSGTRPLGITNVDSTTADVVAVDDLIYSEPLPLDVPVLHSPLRLADGTFEFQLIAPVGKTAAVQFTDDLVTWAPSGIVATAGRVVIPPPARSLARYYRVVVQP